ncbi:Alpha/Beta hydrolase protein [Coniella lustricola]|uniref:Alpha/Beta hydrolase protein n=1 Tax=Coniella lustricola TaxID=2025994 RepID=A0A2T3A9V1_9PEZI|nr:Alpha/Beta hydrolase protein [Coniella lustricola]
MPIEPSLSFTIPSIHDHAATLECRIYHPRSLAPAGRGQPWRRHAAIVAHPYAPLGGCFDDAVVETMTAVLLGQGFLVGTFNFRGAGGSTGRTSWTSKAERNDYISFAAFVYYYTQFLEPFPQQRNPVIPADVQTPLSLDGTAETAGQDTTENSPVLLLCGYSYGAMVTTLLPPTPAVLEPFATPKAASAAADIRLRAQHLAEKQNIILASVRAALSETPASPRKTATGMRVGGDEDRRRSQDHVRHSFSVDADEKIRKGVADLLQRAKARQLHPHHQCLPPVPGLSRPQMAYLLVSPPVGWATSLMTLNVGGLFGKRPKLSKQASESTDTESKETGTSINTPEIQKLVDNPTLTIYGDSDVFVTVKKFRDWAARLQSAPGSRFRAHEVSTAGHFYIEAGTTQRLADAVRAFAAELST